MLSISLLLWPKMHNVVLVIGHEVHDSFTKFDTALKM